MAEGDDVESAFLPVHPIWLEWIETEFAALRSFTPLPRRW
jgi:hypothetical protein